MYSAHQQVVKPRSPHAVPNFRSAHLRAVEVGMVDRLNKDRAVVQETTVYAQCETRSQQ